jgi:hypothetical protein
MKVELFIEDSKAGIEFTLKYDDISELSDSMYSLKDLVRKAVARSEAKDKLIE